MSLGTQGGALRRKEVEPEWCLAERAQFRTQSKVWVWLMGAGGERQEQTLFSEGLLSSLYLDW